MMKDSKKAGQKFTELVEIMDILRGKQGCPWDREQDEYSLANYFLEEVYEAMEALNAQDYSLLAEELGDVLMEVAFLARMAKEKEKFTISDVLDGINKKMIRRHPHVFGPKRVDTSQKVLREWRDQKQKEKDRESFLDGLMKSAPALLTAFQIGQRASLCGFDWKKPLDALQKVKEETAELEEAAKKPSREEAAKEIGDLLFSVANVSRLLNVNPEMALREANQKFIRRFRYIEKKLREKGMELEQTRLEELDRLWEEAKKS